MKHFILLILCVNSFAVLGQQQWSSTVQDSMSTWQKVKFDTKESVGGVLHAFSRPAHWKKKDWTTAGVVVGGTALLYFVDDETSEFFRRNQNDIPVIVDEFGERFGSPQVSYGLTGSVYLFGLLSGNEKWRKTGVLLISSNVTVGLLQTVLKSTVGRSRPQNNQGKFAFKPFSGEAGYRSFPSGHTILSFTTAHVIAKQFDNPWIKAGIYTVGMISPISRVWDGAHWLTDVGLSLAISIASVDAIDRYLNRNTMYPDGVKKSGISWNVQFGLGRVGIIGTF